jgi:hypothetical protein
LENRIDNYNTTITNINTNQKLINNKKNNIKNIQDPKNDNDSKNIDKTDLFDVVFWYGDLNFLVVKEREKVEKKISHLRNMNSYNYDDIINHDELSKVISEGIKFL